MFGHQHPAEFQEVDKAAGQMALVPIRNERARVSDGPDGRYVVVEIDLNYHGMAKRMARMVKASEVRRVQLDGMSLEVFQLIGPGVTVETIVDAIMERHLLSFFEARGLVFWYLQLLAERGVIAVGMEGADGQVGADPSATNGQGKGS